MQYLSLTEAAQSAQLSTGRMRKLAAAGRIKGAQKLGPIWMIPADFKISAARMGPVLKTPKAAPE